MPEQVTPHSQKLASEGFIQAVEFRNSHGSAFVQKCVLQSTRLSALRWFCSFRCNLKASAMSLSLVFGQHINSFMLLDGMLSMYRNLLLLSRRTLLPLPLRPKWHLRLPRKDQLQGETWQKLKAKNKWSSLLGKPSCVGKRKGRLIQELFSFAAEFPRDIVELPSSEPNKRACGPRLPPHQPRETSESFPVSPGDHTVQNFGPETTAIVYGLQNRAVQVCDGEDCVRHRNFTRATPLFFHRMPP